MTIASTNQSPVYDALEASVRTLPATPDWVEVPIINIRGGTGGQFESAQDDTINNDRQPNRGQPVRISAGANLDVAASLSVFQRYTSSLMFHNSGRKISQQIIATGAAAVNDSYIIPAATAPILPYFKAGDLINVKGSIFSSNNGLQVLDADLGAGDTTLGVSGSLTNESPANMSISACGVRKPSGTSSAWDYNSTDNTAELTWNAHGLEAKGVIPGMEIHIGSPNGTGGFNNAMQQSAANDSYGMVTVRRVTTNTIVFENIPMALRGDVSAFTTALDLIFGVPYSFKGVLDSDFITETRHFLQTVSNIGTGGASKYIVSNGLLVNSMSLDFTNNSLSSIALSMIGERSQAGIDATAIAADPYDFTASNRRSPRNTLRFNVSSDIASLSIDDSTSGADQGYSDFMRNWTFDVSNNINAEGGAGSLYNVAVTPGDVSINLRSRAFLVNDAIIQRVIDNEPVRFRQILSNQEGAVSLYCPSIAFGTADVVYERGSTMKVDLNGSADKQNRFNDAMFINVFDIGDLVR